MDHTAPLAPTEVLIVDDSALIRQRVSAMLSSLPNVQIVGLASNVEQAIALADDKLPDVVVLDVELEDGDRGIRVLEHIRSRHGAMRVIALSNFTWQAMRDTYLRAGADAYFDKSMEFMHARDWVANFAHRSLQPSSEPADRPSSTLDPGSSG